MTRSLGGRVAVVTGGGSGIGGVRGIALRLAEDTAKSRDLGHQRRGAEETARMVRAAGGTALAPSKPIVRTRPRSTPPLGARQELGPIAILVNNAGIAPFTPFLETDDELFDKVDPDQPARPMAGHQGMSCPTCSRPVGAG